MTLDDAALVDIGDRITLALSVYVFSDIFRPLVDWDVDSMLPPDPNAPKEKTLTDTLQEYGAKLHRQRRNFEAMADLVQARIMGQDPWVLAQAGAVPVRVVEPVFVAMPDEENQHPPGWVPKWSMESVIAGRALGLWLHPLYLPFLVPTIIDLVKLKHAWKDHLSPMLDELGAMVDKIKAGVAHVIDTALGMKPFILSQVWIAKVLAGFLDRVVLWSADRLTQIMRLVDGGYQAVAKVIGGFVEAIGFNAVTAIRTAIINALLVRIVNFINGKIIQIGMLIAAVFAGWEALFDWLKQLWNRLEVEFENAFLSAINALGSALESSSKTLNSKSKGHFPVIPYTPYTLLPVPTVKPLDLGKAMADRATAAATMLKEHFPTDYTADWQGPQAEKSIRNSWLGDNMAFPPERERKQVPDLGPIPGVQATPVAPAPTAMTVADTGGPQAKGPVSFHMEMTVENLNTSTLGDLARQIATRIHEDLALFRDSVVAAPQQ